MLAVFISLGSFTREFLEIYFTAKPDTTCSLTLFSNIFGLIVLSLCPFTFFFFLFLLLGLGGNPISLIFLPLKTKEHEFDRPKMMTYKSYIHGLPRMTFPTSFGIISHQISS